MEFWIYSFLLLNSIVFIYYSRQINGVFQAPFLMAYTALFIFIPQFVSIYNNSLYDKNLIPDLGFMMLSCNLAFLIGFELLKQNYHPSKNVITILHFSKIKYFVLIFSLVGFSTVFLWNGGSKFQEGDNVIQANIKSFSQIALCLTYTSLLNLKTYKKFIVYVFFISVIPLCYFAFFVKGSRGEILFLLLTMTIFLSIKYPLKEKLIRKLFIIILIMGALFSASIIWIRNIISNNYEDVNLVELSLFDNYIDSFSQKDINLGMDLGNAAYGIRYLKNTNEYDYGTYIYDDFIQNIVPRRVVGEAVKEELKFKIVDDRKFIQNQTHGVTTMTGYYFAFRSFSYFGFIIFFIIGLFYGYIYTRMKNSSLSLFIYLLIISIVPLIFTHSPGYLYMKIYINFFIAYLFCHIGFKHYKILRHG